MTDVPTLAEATPSLRDRKRQQTRSRLEQAALDIVLEDGLENLTIERISERAEVSPRTFFNYFDSKEDAILGLHDPENSELLIAEAELRTADEAATGNTDTNTNTATGARCTDAIMRLLLTLHGDAIRNVERQRARMSIVHQHPQLLSRQFAQMNRMHDLLTDAAQRLIAQDPAFAADADRRRIHADVLLMLCASAIKATVGELARDAAEHGSAAFETSSDELRQRASALVREVIQKLQ
ncbi:helix-turn-helix domain containing protein [Microbacterium sp. STN6]|uniref:TetR/AcrR family transcriptional regulator n=1 Tax=Microbacterium sp. STN6 TaxID=2995588 RepID=UPI002260AA62|nr:TetR/AcrR family transcriptional regulator [Microbacterium sp. STN6]MCX7522928.1 helix-turn-helix domain containing protein [Microbacterium sp. STN6]